MWIHFTHKLGISVKLVDRAYSNQVAPFHAVMILRNGEGVAGAHLAQSQPCAKAGRGGGAQRIGVKAHPIAHPSGVGASIAQIDRDGSFHVAGHQQYGGLHRLPRVAEFGHIAIGQCQCRRRQRVEQGGVFPR